MDEENTITKDRLILACAALEEIRALGGDAGAIAADTLESFERADKSYGSIEAPADNPTGQGEQRDT